MPAPTLTPTPTCNPAAFTDPARQAWRVRTAEAVAAAAADQLRALRGADDAVHLQLEALARREPPAADPLAGIGAVLLVGCEPLVRTCLTLLLEARGVTVLAAADGFEALDLLTADRIGVRVALIGCDLRGCPLPAAVAEYRRFDPLLPVVVLGRSAEQCEEVVAVLPAPFGLADVLWAIDEAVNRGGK